MHPCFSKCRINFNRFMDADRCASGHLQPLPDNGSAYMFILHLLLVRYEQLVHGITQIVHQFLQGAPL